MNTPHLVELIWLARFLDDVDGARLLRLTRDAAPAAAREAVERGISVFVEIVRGRCSKRAASAASGASHVWCHGLRHTSITQAVELGSRAGARARQDPGA